MTFKPFGGQTIACRACQLSVSTDATECPHCGELFKDFKIFGGDTVACRACDQPVSTDATECPNCGEPLKDFKIFGGNTIACRACDQPVSTDATECPRCGEPLKDFKVFGGNTIACRACDQPVSTDTTECPHCGETLKNFKIFGGNTIACRACHRPVSTDATACPYCAESLKDEVYVSKAVYRRTSDSQESEDNEPGGWLIKLLFYAALIIGTIWLAFAVALPLMIIDTALIGFILGLIYTQQRSYWFILSVFGIIVVFGDYNYGWMTKQLVDNVSFFGPFIPFLVYLNLIAGVVASYFLIRQWLGKEASSRVQLLLVGSLAVIGILVFLLQSHFAPDRHTTVTVTSTATAPTSVQTTVNPSTTPSTTVNSTIPGVYSQASVQLLTAGELEGLDKRSLRIMRNEIFARHGYIFKTAEMRNYFAGQSWYQPSLGDVNNQLTDIEKSNIEIIKQYENK